MFRDDLQDERAQGENDHRGVQSGHVHDRSDLLGECDHTLRGRGQSDHGSRGGRGNTPPRDRDDLYSAPRGRDGLHNAHRDHNDLNNAPHGRNDLYDGPRARGVHRDQRSLAQSDGLPPSCVPSLLPSFLLLLKESQSSSVL